MFLLLLMLDDLTVVVPTADPWTLRDRRRPIIGLGGHELAAGLPHPLHEKVLKRLSELPGHAAVDAEVERVRQTDAEVHDQDRRLDYVVVEEVVDRRRHDVQDRDDAKRKFHGQENLN